MRSPSSLLGTALLVPIWSLYLRRARSHEDSSQLTLPATRQAMSLFPEDLTVALLGESAKEHKSMSEAVFFQSPKYVCASGTGGMSI